MKHVGLWDSIPACGFNSTLLASYFFALLFGFKAVKQAALTTRCFHGIMVGRVDTQTCQGPFQISRVVRV